MKRRRFIAGIASAAAWPLVAWGQQSAAALIGFLYAGTAQAQERNQTAFRDGMKQLGYVEGSNIRLEFRFADGYLERLPNLATELVRLNPNVIVSAPLPAHLALQQATKTIPIVMATGADPVGFGLVASLSHPGGNVTGLANFAEILATKQIELLREVAPHLKRYGLLVNVTNPLHAPQLRETQIAAEAARIILVPIEVAGPDRVVSAFDMLKEQQVEALIVPPDTTFYSRRQQIAQLAAKMNLPTTYGYRDHVEVGGLMSYGPDTRDQYRRAAAYVDKILKGASPADLPVEQPTKLEFIVNLRTARALGLNVPPSLLARADEVIE